MSADEIDSKLNLLDWSVEDRPREKYVAKGPRNLSDAELVAILLRSGTPKETVVDLAKRILSLCDNRLSSLATWTLSDWQKIYGIGETKAVTILAAFELGRRLRAEKVHKPGKMISPQDVFEYMQAKNASLNYEESWILFLNQSSQLLKAELVGRGGLSSTVVDARVILRRAIELSATAIILCHNHPSGDVRPSSADNHLTRHLKESAEMVDIKFVDHIIVSSNAYYSYVEEGNL